MKSFTRVMVINGQEYFYEITPYYDKEKKQIDNEHAQSNESHIGNRPENIFS